MANAHCFWLMPAAAEKAFLSKVIRELAVKFDAPLFDSHTTFLVAQGLLNAQACAIIDKIAAQTRPVELQADKLAQEERYSKTFYIKFHSSEIMQRVRTMATECIPLSSSYELNPHLSLLYKSMTEDQRKQLCRRALVPVKNYHFDTVWAVEFNSPWSEKSAREYQVIAKRKLSLV